MVNSDVIKVKNYQKKKKKKVISLCVKWMEQQKRIVVCAVLNGRDGLEHACFSTVYNFKFSGSFIRFFFQRANLQIHKGVHFCIGAILQSVYKYLSKK